MGGDRHEVRFGSRPRRPLNALRTASGRDRAPVRPAFATDSPGVRASKRPRARGARGRSALRFRSRCNAEFTPNSCSGLHCELLLRVEQNVPLWNILFHFRAMCAPRSIFTRVFANSTFSRFNTTARRHAQARATARIPAQSPRIPAHERTPCRLSFGVLEHLEEFFRRSHRVRLVTELRIRHQPADLAERLNMIARLVRR